MVFERVALFAFVVFRVIRWNKFFGSGSRQEETMCRVVSCIEFVFSITRAFFVGVVLWLKGVPGKLLMTCRRIGGTKYLLMQNREGLMVIYGQPWESLPVYGMRCWLASLSFGVL